MIDLLRGRFAEEFSSEEMKNKIINDTTDAIYTDLSVLLEDSLKLEVAEGVMTKLSEEIKDEGGSDESALTGSGDVQPLAVA